MMHTHHNHCEHALKFCEKCDRPYCTKCSREWYSSQWTLNNSPWYGTTTGYQGATAIGLYQSSGTNPATKTVLTTSGPACAHS